MIELIAGSLFGVIVAPIVNALVAAAVSWVSRLTAKPKYVQIAAAS